MIIVSPSNELKVLDGLLYCHSAADCRTNSYTLSFLVLQKVIILIAMLILNQASVYVKSGKCHDQPLN